jgi:hypothetical protein
MSNINIHFKDGLSALNTAYQAKYDALAKRYDEDFEALVAVRDFEQDKWNAAFDELKATQ